MDLGAHFHRCDFQVHSPRDPNWDGARCQTPDDCKQYAEEFVSACRAKGLQAVAITDHHDFTFFTHIKQAAQEERSAGGEVLAQQDRLVVFPGMELTLGVPCQAILLLDADYPVAFLNSLYNILNITPPDPALPRNPDTRVLEHVTSLNDLCKRLDENDSLRGKYIVLVNVTEGGHKTLLRAGNQAKYKQMPCVGGYTDGPMLGPASGAYRIITGRITTMATKPLASSRPQTAGVGPSPSWELTVHG